MTIVHINGIEFVFSSHDSRLKTMRFAPESRIQRFTMLEGIDSDNVGGPIIRKGIVGVPSGMGGDS